MNWKEKVKLRQILEIDGSKIVHSAIVIFLDPILDIVPKTMIRAMQEKCCKNVQQ